MSFRLPGEAQKIDRMMECFAKKYCDQNEGVFTSTGSVQASLFFNWPTYLCALGIITPTKKIKLTSDY